MSDIYTVRRILEDTPDSSLLVIAEQMGVQGRKTMTREHLINILEPLIRAQAA